MEELLAASSHHRTFRDPAGNLAITPDGVFRHVYAPYEDDLLEFLDHPIVNPLVAGGRLIASEVLPRNAGEPLLLRHPRVSFRSYPWEWSPALWLAAADLTLGLCIDLVKQGWILKDATPLNILFQGSRPIFVDVLSIQHIDPSDPVWYAYGQFIRTFLLPLLAHTKLGWPLQITLTRRDGYEPEDIYSALTWTDRLRQPALSSITLPMLLASKTRAGSASLASRKPHDPEVAQHVLLRTLNNLRSQMRRVAPSHRDSTWSDYTATATHYSQEDHTGKQAFVGAALAAVSPSRVLDIGCNTGVYSLLAAGTGASVVSIDTDMQAVDRLATRLKDSGMDILPLCVSLAHPTPSVGWENREYPSFLERACSHFDAVMMLAVLHHLLLADQIPLDQIALLCSRLTTNHLIIEWVPPSDPKFREILRGRDALYTHITETAFRGAFAPYFNIITETTLANHRILFHMQRTNS